MFPTCLKVAKVVPIYKCGNRMEKSNYRHNFLLSNISKVIEKSVKTRLVQFFDKHNILFENEFGFRKNHSTNQALLNVVTQCLDNTDAKNTAVWFY